MSTSFVTVNNLPPAVGYFLSIQKIKRSKHFILF